MDLPIDRKKDLPTGKTFGLRAQNTRRMPTGVHANLELTLNGVVLSWGYLNVERDEDRVRLANSTHRMLGEDDRAAYPKEYLKHDLDLFCRELWPAFISQHRAEKMFVSSEPPPIGFILRPYILEDAGTIVFAPPGKGKSYLGLIWAVSIDAGISSLWHVKQVPTYYINLERSRSSLERRLYFVNQALGLPVERELWILNARGKNLTEVADAVAQDVQEHGIQLVVVDSLSRAGVGDMNENAPMNRAMDVLNGLGCAWVALGHTPRSDDTHLFGSIMQEAAADVVIQLGSQSRQSSLGIGLLMTKKNDLPEQPLEVITLEFEGNHLASIAHGKKSDFPELATIERGGLPELIEEFILSQEWNLATLGQIATGLGRNSSNLHKVLKADDRFTQVSHNGKAHWGMSAEPPV